jgi:DNA invertase Pin-like site-specific DNA recombinase
MEEDKEIERLIRRRWNQINWRIHNCDSYLKKQIENQFDDYEQFRLHAISSGIELRFQTHRLDKDGHYSIDNTTFVSPEEHLRISSLERRVLTVNQVLIARDMHANGVSTHKIAKQFGCSQTTVWRCVTRITYADVIEPTDN